MSMPPRVGAERPAVVVGVGAVGGADLVQAAATASHDVGKAIHPKNVIGQIMGGVTMGTGFALIEEFVPEKTTSFVDYLIPTSKDVPEVIPIIVEDEEPSGPYGAKGVGEPALIPSAPAILNAIADATGQRIYHLPANLERVLEAVQKNKRRQ